MAPKDMNTDSQGSVIQSVMIIDHLQHVASQTNVLASQPFLARVVYKFIAIYVEVRVATDLV